MSRKTSAAEVGEIKQEAPPTLQRSSRSSSHYYGAPAATTAMAIKEDDAYLPHETQVGEDYSEEILPHPAPPPPKKKRTQVKVACVHCRKACKRCDEARPCARCVHHNFRCYDEKKDSVAKKKVVKGGTVAKRTSLREKSIPAIAVHEVIEEETLHLQQQEPTLPPRTRFPSASSLRSLTEDSLVTLAHSAPQTDDLSHEMVAHFPQPAELKLLSDVCGMLLEVAPESKGAQINPLLHTADEWVDPAYSNRQNTN